MAARLAPPDPSDDDVRPASSANMFLGPLTLIVAAAILYLAQEIFVPLAIAGLLSFVLTPPMVWLRRHYVPRVPAAFAVVLLAFALIFGFGSIVANEMVSLARELPTYQANIAHKLQSAHNALPLDQLFQRGTQLLEELRGELTASGTSGAGTNTPPPTALGGQTPLPVQITQGPSYMQVFAYVAGPVLRPLATAGLVLVFAIFFLLYREDLRDRFIRLAGTRDLHRATQILNEAVQKLSQYLMTEFAINAGYGLLIGLGTFVIGVPNAALWAVLFLVLRFVPYIGTWLAVLFPLALSLAVAPGWTMFFETLGLFLAIELLVSNAVEPLLFGRTTGLSPVAVLVAATFWTWLWGPIGLVLSTPLTACLAVIGRYAPPLRFLVVLLGQEAPLTAEESFYQRLLADDATDVAEQAESFLRSDSLENFYDLVVLPALVMAEEDCERGVLKRDKRVQIRDTITEMVETLVEENRMVETPAPHAPFVYCLGARNELDEAAASLVAQLLAHRGIAARASTAQQWLAETRNGAPAPHEPPPILCLSHLGNAAPSRARLLIRRLRRYGAPDTKIVLGLWSAAVQAGESQSTDAEMEGADVTVTSLAAAAARIAVLLSPADARRPPTPPEPAVAAGQE